MFHAFQDKGFQVAFANGLTFSVMFGKGNYCEHRHAKHNCPNGSVNAEIAVFVTEGGDERYIFADGFHGTGLCGWLSAEQVAAAMAVVSTYKAEEPRSELVQKLESAILSNKTPA